MYKKTYVKKQGYCLMCFKSLFEDVCIKSLIFPNKYLCDHCKGKLKEINQIEYVLGVKVKYLYEYNQFMKDMIYQYKGCYDIVLKDVFLHKHKSKIKKEFKNYFVIFPPSNLKEDKKRGFNHIEEIVKGLKLKSDYMFYKEKEVKQTSLKYVARQQIENIIKIKKDKCIDRNKKYLIVDDIVTTKATLKTIIKILLKNGVSSENISAIIISKKADFVEL